ncbi:MAG: hypothetical protein FD123_4103 [Bacteroidetes bacterium]|nr:MAG: hypothetical protein FD123_4103 [Bacteroidota bacterium]
MSFGAAISALIPSDSTTPSGITFEGYSDEEFNSKVGTWEGKFNPSTIQYESKVEYFEDVPIGAASSEVRFKRMPPSKIAFSIMLDNFDSDSSNAFLALMGSPTLSTVDPIITQATNLKNVIYNMNSSTHQPNYVRIQFGDNTFYGRASKFDVKYTEFKSNGEATRAAIEMAFTGSKSKKMSASELQLNSPDMTHAYVCKEGDTLTMLAVKYYNNPNLFHELARINRLNGVRRLVPGTVILIPPLQKT